VLVLAVALLYEQQRQVEVHRFKAQQDCFH
jgi:hypothetical protein